MSQSIQEPPFGADIYYYYVEKRIKGKKTKVKIRVRISEKHGDFYSLQQVRDGYITWTKNLDNLIKE